MARIKSADSLVKSMLRNMFYYSVVSVCQIIKMLSKFYSHVILFKLRPWKLITWYRSGIYISRSFSTNSMTISSTACLAHSFVWEWLCIAARQQCSPMYPHYKNCEIIISGDISDHIPGPLIWDSGSFARNSFCSWNAWQGEPTDSCCCICIYFGAPLSEHGDQI